MVIFAWKIGVSNTREVEGGPSLSIITSLIKPKGKLMDVICEALEVDHVRKECTALGTGVQSHVRHPRCAPGKLPDFVLLIN